MKKIMFLLVVAAAAMTGCVKSEVIDVAESRVIEFDPFVGKHTKADQTATIIGTRSELKAFYVYGNMSNAAEKVFDNVEVYYEGNPQNGHYTYADDAKVWLSGHNYYFAAVSDGNKEPEANVTYDYNGAQGSNTLVIEDYTVGFDDLIADIADPVNTTGSMVGKETVTFDFRHLLTRVRFVINNDVSTENSVVLVKDLKFDGVKKANCNYTLTPNNNNYIHSYTWDLTGTSDKYQYTDANVDAPTDATIDNGKFYIKPGQSKQFGHFVIPQTSDRQVSFILETYTKTDEGYKLTDTKDYTYDLDYDNDPVNSNSDDFLWQPGKVYQYAIKVAGTTSYIRFESTVQGWDWDINNDGNSNSSDDIQIAN